VPTLQGYDRTDGTIDFAFKRGIAAIHYLIETRGELFKKAENRECAICSLPQNQCEAGLINGKDQLRQYTKGDRRPERTGCDPFVGKSFGILATGVG